MSGDPSRKRLFLPFATGELSPGHALAERMDGALDRFDFGLGLVLDAIADRIAPVQRP